MAKSTLLKTCISLFKHIEVMLQSKLVSSLQ